MAKFELKLPKMGESVAEATLISWLKEVGDTIEMDDGILEVSTDKVDTEIPCEIAGILVEKRFEIDDVIRVGETIAIIETEDVAVVSDVSENQVTEENITAEQEPEVTFEESKPEAVSFEQPILTSKSGGPFYSPLVRSMAQKENISVEELKTITGTGKEQRITKNDMLAYLDSRGSHVEKQAPAITKTQEPAIVEETQATAITKTQEPAIVEEKQPQKQYDVTQNTVSGDEVIAMDRMSKLIAEHMVHSVQTSAHVQSFIEIDVTGIVRWRAKVKDQFLRDKGEKLTYTPIFMQAVAKAITKFPMVNISVDGTNIIKKKAINLGMATALPNGNLIVPVIKNADELNLFGMVKIVNSLASKARNSKLSPDDIQGGTYTVTNVGSFGSTTGTPIINQPQVAILALGAIRKMPAVVETSEGDFIGIRHIMIMAHSYDHRVVNGALGGQFVKAVKDYLEGWDSDREI